MADQAALQSLAEACDAENADPLACYGDFFVAAGDALRAALVRTSSDLRKNESQCELVSCACDGSALGVYEGCEVILEEVGAGNGHGGGGEARRDTLITLFVTLGICFCVCVVVGVPLLWWLRRRHFRRKEIMKREAKLHTLLAQCTDQLTQGGGGSGRTPRRAGSASLRDLDLSFLSTMEESAKDFDVNLASSESQRYRSQRSFGASFGRSGSRREVVFVVTDIENSTLCSELNQQAFCDIQEAHDLLMRDALDEFGGYEINTEGDSFRCAFDRATQALLFCVRVQMELLQYPWSPEVLALPGMGEIRSLLQERQGRGGKSSEAVVWRGPRVRMGVHCARDYAVERHKLTGALQASGSGLNLANEVESCASGGQILVTRNAADKCKSEASVFHLLLSPLGIYSLKSGPVPLYQAQPATGPLSFRGFPAISKESVGDPLALQAKPITGQVVLVTLRVCDDDEKEEDNNFRGFPVVAEDTLMRQDAVVKATFWRQCQRKFEGSQILLRSWIQQFGGYEQKAVEREGIGYLVVVFRGWEAAIKFAMVVQVGTLMMPRDRRARLAAAVCEGKSFSETRCEEAEENEPPELESFSTLQEFKNTDNERQVEDRSPEGRAVKGIVMQLAHSFFATTGRAEAEVGDPLWSHPAWGRSYAATICSAYCGGRVSPASYLGKKVLVLFFYFTDKTWGCVMEAKYFRDYYMLFQAHGAEVIGVSLDGRSSQQAFSSGLQLPYPLISDVPGGLHRIFSGSRLDQLTRRTYIVSKTGHLVDKYTTTLGIDGKGYPHVMHALEKVQDMWNSERLREESGIGYRGAALCRQVCEMARERTILVALPAGRDVWDDLPSLRGPARPCLVDFGNLEVGSGSSPGLGDPKAGFVIKYSLYGVLPSVLADRWKTREGLRGAHRVNGGAFQAPDPASRVTFVFTFVHAAAMGSSDCLDSAITWADLARQELLHRGGYECQEVGEGNFMLAFDNVPAAVVFCAEAQRRVSESGEDKRIGVAMGVASGVPAYGKPHSKTGRQDYFGKVVNLAARVAKRAKPGQVLAALTQQDTQKWPQGLAIHNMGKMAFKGIGKRTEVYQVG